ncbi:MULTISPECIES: NADH:flavin oxidoreductase [Bacillaceae]|uniref:NADH:flavin oxidoreductase n=1 Tax=Alkalicoccobacillus plakortidis TaxID=444060 RepID=A0A9D5I2H6_9BACI|nr:MULTISPECIES: NADH:flavin oxidoreductase [Bacillaceae]KQL58774.1 NADH:flavin oxidoreductase [Alkalicoccobacillus plakortidis]
MLNEKELLLNQGTIGNHIFKNRYIVAPMTRVSSSQNGKPNETVHRYYERFAKGGFSAIISEGIYPDTEHSQGYECQPGLATHEQMEAWKPIVETIHENRSLFIAQLMHAGAQSQGNAYTNETVAPSVFTPPSDKVALYGGQGSFPEARPLSIEEIEQIKKGFVQAARRAQEAGFDGIELHGANGYLLDQFLSEGSNQRGDAYGGSIENRLKLIVDLITEVREAVGATMLLGVRISQMKATDPSYKWEGGEAEAATLFSALGETDIDYIHLSERDAKIPAFGNDSMLMSEVAKRYSNKPIIACGSLENPAEAAKLIAIEQCDFIALGRQALVQPDFPNRFDQGEPLMEVSHVKHILSDNTTPAAAISEEELKMDVIKNEEVTQ